MIWALPRIIGHRGAAGLAPENTLASFALAADLGCTMVEFDVRLTRDGHPIVFHDDTLDRCTDGSGPVGALTLAQLAGLRVMGAEPIPTLAQVLEVCAARRLAVNMEIKPDRGTEWATAAAALGVALAGWPADRPPPLVSSFRDPCLKAARAVAPHWPLGLLVDRPTDDGIRRALALGCVSLGMAERWATARRVARVRRDGLAVMAYTVNRRHRAHTLWRLGVDAVFSDRPGHLS